MMNQDSYYDESDFEKKEKKQKKKHLSNVNYIPYALIYSFP